MATKEDKARKDAKAKAVAHRLDEMRGSIDLLTGMLDERTLDALILALGLGRVELDD